MSSIRKESWLKADDCNLRVITFENDLTTPVLILLHGGPGSGADPLLELSAFQRLNEIFTTVYFDQRGTGKSYYDLSKQITKEQAASDVHQTVTWAKNKFPDKKIFLWGASYGGLLALLYLDIYPNEVDKAVICSPAILSPNQMNATMEGFRIGMSDQIKNLPKEYREAMESSQPSSIFDDNPKMDILLSSLKELPKSFEAPFFVYSIRSWFSKYDATSVLPKIQIPTLIIHGENDLVCPFSGIKDAFDHATNPNLTFIPFKNCGHATFEDCEDSFVEEIKHFLSLN